MGFMLMFSFADNIVDRASPESCKRRAQVSYSIERVKATVPRLLALAQGGTAVGTGLNAKKGFAEAFAQAIADDTGAACQGITPSVATPNVTMACPTTQSMLCTHSWYQHDPACCRLLIRDGAQQVRGSGGA